MNMLNRDLGTGDLCDNIGLVGVSAKWSYVTASPSHHDKAIPILSPLLFMHVGHPYIPFFKIGRIFDLLVNNIKPHWIHYVYRSTHPTSAPVALIINSAYEIKMCVFAAGRAHHTH